jgi:hypothetical protein
MFPGGHFTPDGHMVGSIGEAIAAYHYGIDLSLVPFPISIFYLGGWPGLNSEKRLWVAHLSLPGRDPCGVCKGGVFLRLTFQNT